MRIAIWMFLLAAILGGCSSSSNEESEQDPFLVVTTTGMIGDLVRNIGGDSIEVISLMGPGVDPHLYKATQGDLAKLQEADIIFYNGLHLEGKMGEVFEKLGQIKKIVAIGASVDEQLLLDDPVYQGNYDPHIWFDVSLWTQTIAPVSRALSEALPEVSNYFEVNAEAYKNELLKLHQWVTKEIKQIPEEKRTLITAHDAFNYFGRAYGLEVRGLQGISTLSEFGLKDRVDLVNFIVDHKIKAVFVETSVSEKNIQSIVEGCRQKGHEVIIGEELYSDAMGADGTPEGTYFGMVQTNVRHIVESLK